MAGYILVTDLKFDAILSKLKRQKPVLYIELDNQITKIIREPNFGKPTRNVLRGYRRVHVGSHVLVYELRNLEIRLIDFDHHDKIYKKYK